MTPLTPEVTPAMCYVMLPYPIPAGPGICTDLRPDTELPSLWESLPPFVNWAPVIRIVSNSPRHFP